MKYPLMLSMLVLFVNVLQASSLPYVQMEEAFDDFSDKQKKIIIQRIHQLVDSNAPEDRELQTLMREAQRTDSSKLFFILGLNILLEPLKLKASEFFGGDIYIYNLYEKKSQRVFKGRRDEKVTLAQWKKLDLFEQGDLKPVLVNYYTIFICPAADQLVTTLFLIINWITNKAHPKRLNLIDSIVLHKTNDHYLIKLLPVPDQKGVQILLKKIYQLLNNANIIASPICKTPPTIRVNDLISYAQGDEFYKNPNRVLPNDPHPDEIFDKEVDYALYRPDFISKDPSQRKNYRLAYD